MLQKIGRNRGDITWLKNFAKDYDCDLLCIHNPKLTNQYEPKSIFDRLFPGAHENSNKWKRAYYWDKDLKNNVIVSKDGRNVWTHKGIEYAKNFRLLTISESPKNTWLVPVSEYPKQLDGKDILVWHDSKHIYRIINATEDSIPCSWDKIKKIMILGF